MIDKASEAESLLQAGRVVEIRAEHRQALRAKHGAIPADRMLQDAASQTPIRAVESAVIHGASPKPYNLETATLEGATAEFARDPVMCSPASRSLLRVHWGESEYKRRLAAAVQSSGALNRKVDCSK